MAVAALLLASSAWAVENRFHKDGPGSMNGFVAAKDPLYLKECGACHFAYSPGMLPARSWERHLERLDKHFGETIALDTPTREALRRYLTANAADVSPYEGSKIFMERIDPASTPYRIREVPRFRIWHRVILEVIDTKPKIKVRTLTNCNACHLTADEGSFGLDDLSVPGLTPSKR